jgi:microcystin-dependent protein
MPSHNHGITDPGHTHSYLHATINSTKSMGGNQTREPEETKDTDIGYTNITIQNKGDGQSHNNLQPYITCYIWKRIT